MSPQTSPNTAFPPADLRNKSAAKGIGNKPSAPNASDKIAPTEHATERGSKAAAAMWHGLNSLKMIVQPCRLLACPTRERGPDKCLRDFWGLRGSPPRVLIVAIGLCFSRSDGLFCL